jgi:aminopeptidase N
MKFSMMWTLVGLCLIGTPFSSAEVGSSPLRENADWLTEGEAIRRARMVDDVQYRLRLDLTRAESFSGTVEIDFEYKPASEPLTIDFSKGEILTLQINGRPQEVEYNGFFLSILPERLEAGANTLEIAYEHPFSDDGTGLYRFEDPVDDLSYVYSYLWPYYANRVFPCFDQPDLKARYELSVRAPEDWTVVSTTRENRIEAATAGGSARVWHFPESAKLSTYVYSFHAGPYRIWESKAEKIPIRLLARQSLSDRISPEIWFDYTRRGFDFFAEYFDIPYPFDKYDQLIVPDFNIGAMENVAAVTFMEGYVWRGDPTRAELEGLARVVLHEMAHMWFGNLVTKKWWNGLWLNESFATLMATLASVEVTEFDDAWHNFYLGSKRSAYYADGLVTTHPIEVPVENTSKFFDVFDSITYGKGASVLKQLMYSVGASEFRDGVRSYLKQHAYGNTRLDDFIRSISVASGRDLESWSYQWLETAGTSTLAAKTACVSGRVSSLGVAQTAPTAWPTLRDHRAEIALYSLHEAGSPSLGVVVPLDLKGESADLPSAVGQPCPDIVFPNHGDWGYFRVLLEPESLTALESSLSSIGDPLARSMIWGSLWDMTKTADLPLTRFSDMVIALLPEDSNTRVVSQTLDYLDSSLGFMHRRRPESRPVIREYGPRIEDFLWKGVTRSPAGSDLQKIWFDHFVSAAHTSSSLDRLNRVLTGDIAVAGLDVDQDRRWRVLVRLASFGHGSVADLRAAEEKRDPSYSGKLWSISVAASVPEIETKKRWIEEFQTTTDPLPFGQQRQAMSTLFPDHQTELQSVLLDDILKPLPSMSQDRDAYFLTSYGYQLLGSACSREAVEKISRLLDLEHQLSSPIERALFETRQSTERCLRLDLGG